VMWENDHEWSECQDLEGVCGLFEETIPVFGLNHRKTVVNCNHWFIQEWGLGACWIHVYHGTNQLSVPYAGWSLHFMPIH